VADWKFENVSIGFPGPVIKGKVANSRITLALGGYVLISSEHSAARSN